MKGSYILLINIKEYKKIQIGKLGNIFFKKGNYAYVGSGLNNLEKRIQRHFSSEKKMHWHIDYFLKHSKILKVFYRESNKKEECKIANFLNKKFNFIPNFGSTDCKCKSHLFYGLKQDFEKSADKIKMNKYCFNANT